MPARSYWVSKSSSFQRYFLPIALLAFSALAGCGAPQGPHVRFASATASQIEAARASGSAVWFDFEAGDAVPLELGVLGVMRAATDPPVRMVAARAFSIVIFPDGSTMFSFDGRSLEPANSARWAIGLDADARGPHAAIVLFIGAPGDMPSALR